MSSIETDNDFYKCYQEKDYAVISAKKGAKGILTKVGLKEKMISTLKNIENLPEIKGIAVIYTDQYQDDAEYLRFLSEMLSNKSVDGKEHNSMRYRAAIIQFYKIILNYPKPIAVGMNGNIGPDSLGLSFACDVRIATEKTIFMNPDIQMGFPPSALLSFFLVQSLYLLRKV